MARMAGGYSRLQRTIRRAVALGIGVLFPVSGWATITPTGNVVPAYPGGGPDPWNVGAELQVGFSADGSLSVTGDSQVTSAGGTIGFDPGVVGTVSLTGSSSWTNTQDLNVGTFGNGNLHILQGAHVQNVQASLGHIDGTADVLVQGAGSTWTSTGQLVVGNGHQATLTVEDEAAVVSSTTWIGLNSGASGSVVIDGPGSSWTVLQSLSLGDLEDGGAATLSLTGAGSRVYVGAAAAQQGSQIPSAQTALIISATNGTAQLSIYGGNTIMNSGNGYLGVGATEVGSVTIDGPASAWHNTGSVEIGGAGSGTLTLIGGGTVSAGGTLTIGSLGTLTGNGTAAATVANAGTIRPGSAASGTLTVTGNCSQSASGKLVVELFGAGVGQFDRLQVSGAASLGGELEVLLGSNGPTPFAPQLGDTFTFLSAALGRTGTFGAADLPALGAGRMWQVRYTATAASLAVTQAGDYNDDGTVNAADYVVWRQLIGGPYNPRADGDTNGVINAADYAIWRANFGSVAGSGFGGSSGTTVGTVPEPPTFIFLIAAGFLVLAVGDLRSRERASWRDK
jgi:T5SS/PEP-CTERM-associated repeat protein